MSKNGPQISVLTANRLGDGAVVFLDRSGDWAERLVDAAVARSPEEMRAFEARGAQDAARNLVVDPYLAEVGEGAHGPIPLSTRERVRVAGPSILGDVPGYSPSLRAWATAPHSPSAQGEGRGEGQTLAPAFASVAAPHPDPLPIVKNDGEREKHALVA